MGWIRNGSVGLFTALMLCLSPQSARAQNVLTVIQNMDYGEVVVTAGGGTITMNASTGAITGTTGGVSNTAAFATFNGTLQVTGPAGRTFSIFTTTGSFPMNGPGGGTFAVGTAPLTSDLPGDQGTLPNAPPANTTKLFHVGGPITIPFGLPTGTYSGFLPLFVQDNGNGTRSGTVNLPVFIRIQIPIALSKTSDLDFGIIIPGGAAGTVTLVPSTGVENFGGGVLYAAATGQPAIFAITGGANHTYNIAATPSPLTLNGSLGGTLSLTLTTDLGASGTLNGTGNGTVKVGGTLSVGATQIEGNYTGNFQMTVSYP